MCIRDSYKVAMRTDSVTQFVIAAIAHADFISKPVAPNAQSENHMTPKTAAKARVTLISDGLFMLTISIG